MLGIETRASGVGLPPYNLAAMAEPTLRLIRCPCCRTPLYTLKTIKPGGTEGWQLSEDSPSVHKDKNGPFIKCAKCSRRIAIVKNRKAPAGLEVAANQKCDQFLA